MSISSPSELWGARRYQSEADAAAFARGITELGIDNQIIFATGSNSLAKVIPGAVVIELRP